MPDTRALRICAVVAVRNESHYLRVLLPRLANQSIDVCIIDHESDDGTSDLLEEFAGKPVMSVVRLAYLGFFSLRQQLEAKERVLDELDHDWVVHQDADEILEHRNPGQGLREAIEEADAQGFNALNFDEFTFIPEPDADHVAEDYVAASRRYYFFEPYQSRLHRAWKLDSDLGNRAHAGHRLEGRGILLSPVSHELRHYIVLNQQHAFKKYLNRCFDPEEIAMGWHENRVSLSAEQLTLPEDSPFLCHAEANRTVPLTRSRPTQLHYWNWRTT